MALVTSTDNGYEMMAKMNERFSAQRETYTTRVNTQGVNMLAMIVQVFPKVPGSKSVSTGFTAYIGALSGGAVAVPEFVGKTNTPSGELILTPGTVHNFSVYGDGPQGVSFGVIAELTDIKAKSVEGRTFLNVAQSTPCAMYCIGLIYQGLLATGVTTSRLSDVKWKVEDTRHYSEKTIYSENYVILNVKSNYDEEFASTVGDNTSIQPNVSTNEANWMFKKAGELEEHMRMVMQYLVFQWNGALEEEDEAGNKKVKKIQKIQTEVCGYAENLVPFLITDVAAWKELAPCFITNMEFFVIGQVPLKKTQDMITNVLRERESPDVPFDFALTIQARGFVFDAAANYRRVGIPVTKEYAITVVKGPVTNRYNPKESPVICLNEYEGDLFRLLDENQYGPIEFRVLVNVPFNNQMLEHIAKLTPADGDILMKAFGSSRGFNSSSYPSDHPMKYINLVAANPRKYVFAIFTEREKNYDTIKLQAENAKGADRRVLEFIQGAFSAQSGQQRLITDYATVSNEDVDDNDISTLTFCDDDEEEGETVNNDNSDKSHRRKRESSSSSSSSSHKKSHKSHKKDH